MRLELITAIGILFISLGVGDKFGAWAGQVSLGAGCLVAVAAVWFKRWISGRQ